MSRAVCKFPLSFTTSDAPGRRNAVEVEMPEGAGILHFEIMISGNLREPEKMGQHPTIWALVETGRPSQTRRFEIFGTGQNVPAGAIHVGTFCEILGPLVWHVFDVTRVGRPLGLELPDDQADALRELIEGGACIEVTGGTLERVTVAGARLSTEGMVAAAVLREAGFTVVDA